MHKRKQMFAVMIVLSLALLGGCETRGGSASIRGGSGHTHSH